MTRARAGEHSHAILGDGTILFMEGERVRRVEIPAIATTDDMLRWAATYRINTLWVQPGCAYARWEKSRAASSLWNVVAGYESIDDKEYFRTISARCDETWITVTWPEFAYEWHDRAFPHVKDMDMLGALRYLEQAFNRRVHHNPGVTGRELMEAYNDTQRRKEWIASPGIDLDSLPKWKGDGFTYQVEIDDAGQFLEEWKATNHIWRLDSTMGMADKIWLHSYDVNSQ